MSNLMETYKRLPVAFARGEGVFLEDTDGKRYLDALTGLAVCGLGHAHPNITRAIADQAGTLTHTSNLYEIPLQTSLAEKLCARSGMDKVFFGNSGAEANEAAIKLARKYCKDNGQSDRHRIVAMDKSFHGRTMATLSATGQEKIRKGFDPVLPGFEFVPFDDIKALEARVDESTCAVMLEPIQGEGGVRCPQKSFLNKVRQICDRAGALLIFDEIQTGMGRTGKLFAYEHFAVQPDIMTLAKALANGLPMGAMLATEKIAASFGPGAHASTFGGTPLVSAAACEVLRIMTEGDLLDNCRQAGDYLKKRLQQLKERYDIVKDVRGLGLLLGMELTVSGEPIVNACLRQGYLINCIQEKVLRFIPPLTITTEQIDGLIECLDSMLAAADAKGK
jgi:acetylornithine aminotransferase